jgi:hypothetical protein
VVFLQARGGAHVERGGVAVLGVPLVDLGEVRHQLAGGGVQQQRLRRGQQRVGEVQLVGQVGVVQLAREAGHDGRAGAEAVEALPRSRCA